MQLIADTVKMRDYFFKISLCGLVTCILSPDNLINDERPQVTGRNDNVVINTKLTEAVILGTSEIVLKKLDLT